MVLHSSHKTGHPKQEGQRGRLSPQSFLSMCPFLLMSPLNVLFLKEVIYMKINKQNHEQIRKKHNTFKRSSFFI